MTFERDVPPIQVHLCVEGGDSAITFYEKALGAVCTYRQAAQDGVRVLHANLVINGGEVMLHGEFPEHCGEVSAPTRRGAAGLTINLNLGTPEAVDAAVARAAGAGAVMITPPDDTFWGARHARIRDPFGHVWAFNAPIDSPPAA